jgi:hypothetical protein
VLALDETTMKWPILKCPFCAGILPNSELYPGKPLKCPKCAALLQPSRSQGLLSAFIGLCFTLVVCYLVGLSGGWFFIAAIVLWFPVFVVCNFVFVRLTPPRFETYVPAPPGLGYRLISLGLNQPMAGESTGSRDTADSHEATTGQSEKDTC